MQTTMRDQTNASDSLSRPLVWSAAIHVAAMVAIAWLAMSYLRVELPLLEAEPFTLVHADGADAFAAPASVDSPRVNFRAPRPVAPALPRAAVEAVKPAGSRISPAPTPTRITPARAQTNHGERMSFAEFRQRHPPNAMSATPPARRPATAVAHVDLDAIDAVAPTGGDSSEAPARVEHDDALSDILQRELARAFTKRADLDAGLEVRIRFLLRADGSVCRAELVESSGNRAFDQAVLDTLQRFRLDRIEPRLAGRVFETTFRTLTPFD